MIRRPEALALLRHLAREVDAAPRGERWHRTILRVLDTSPLVERPRAEGMAGKAARLLAEGRVTVRRFSGDDARFLVQGDSDRYEVIWHGEAASWVCSCPARGNCSHLAAVLLIAEGKL